MPLSPTASDPRGADERPALILANLGTPSAPTARAVRPFLREFLSDRRIVETHPLLWRPVLEGIILRVRPRASAAKYATIWRPGEENSRSGSPLMHYSQRQGELLQEELGESVQVRVAMRYGQPALRRVMGELMEAGCHRIALIPLYPQYAASSAGTVVDEAARFILASRNQPELRTIRSFETAPAYIEALATALEQHWQVHGRPDPAAGERLLLSFHSIPQAMHDAGDPYRAECERTVELRPCRSARPDVNGEGLLLHALGQGKRNCLRISGSGEAAHADAHARLNEGRHFLRAHDLRLQVFVAYAIRDVNHSIHPPSQGRPARVI